jgi:hypothetical protein
MHSTTEDTSTRQEKDGTANTRGHTLQLVTRGVHTANVIATSTVSLHTHTHTHTHTHAHIHTHTHGQCDR